MGVVFAVLAVVAVLVLVVVVALADRVLAREAERRASAYLAAPLGRAARVQINGSPFLTQAARGRYRSIDVTAADFTLGVLRHTGLQAHLVNAYLPLRHLVRRDATELPVEHVHGELLIDYGQLARASRIPGLRFTYRDERLIATARLPIPGLGEVGGVSGEAFASISETGGVSVRVRNVSVAGFALPSMVLAQLVPALAFAVPLPPLPYGLRISGLTPAPDGLQVSGQAQAVVFRSDPAARLAG